MLNYIDEVHIKFLLLAMQFFVIHILEPETYTSVKFLYH